mmetsp:Transcript_22681/g.66040  ORF Transcript_22681/g.66040 Transcript_22681/m.66040 type:complete len:236 (-) Transcript_22681:233-940(-)
MPTGAGSALEDFFFFFFFSASDSGGAAMLVCPSGNETAFLSLLAPSGRGGGRLGGGGATGGPARFALRSLRFAVDLAALASSRAALVAPSVSCACLRSGVLPTTTVFSFDVKASPAGGAMGGGRVFFRRVDFFLARRRVSKFSSPASCSPWSLVVVSGSRVIAFLSPWGKPPSGAFWSSIGGGTSGGGSMPSGGAVIGRGRLFFTRSRVFCLSSSLPSSPSASFFFFFFFFSPAS